MLFYHGLLARSTWRLFSGPKLTYARLGVVQTRMAHHSNTFIPPRPPLSRDNTRVLQVLSLSSKIGDLFGRAPPDLPEQLLSTITANPGLNGVMALYASEHPEVSIRSVLQILPRTSDDLIYNDFSDEEGYEPGPFRVILKDFVARLVRHNLYQPKQVAHIPPNMVLIAALFSANAVKFGLLDDDFIYAFTRYGLQLPASDTFGNEWNEVAVIAAIGACLQLITAGSVFMEKHLAKTDGLANVIVALENLRVKRLILNPQGLKLLEKTIEAAKANFANSLSASDALNVLFPKS